MELPFQSSIEMNVKWKRIENIRKSIKEYKKVKKKYKNTRKSIKTKVSERSCVQNVMILDHLDFGPSWKAQNLVFILLLNVSILFRSLFILLLNVFILFG